MWCWMTDVIIVISLQIRFPRRLTIEPAQGQHHGFSHETKPMAIKKANNFLCTLAHFRLLRVGPAVAMVPESSFACEQLRQPSEVLRTHNRKKLVVRLNSFSLLPSSFREGRGDAQTQQAETEEPTFPQWYPLRFKKKVCKNMILLLMQQLGAFSCWFIYLCFFSSNWKWYVTMCTRFLKSENAHHCEIYAFTELLKKIK